MKEIRTYLYYILIGIISLISLCFLPFLGSEVGLEWNIPDTPVGWVIWITTKMIVAILNVLIFHCFMQQGKLNVKDSENFQKAREILMIEGDKESQPKSPARWLASQYGGKAGTIAAASMLATIALGQSILTFDWIGFISYLFTIIMGLIFGFLQMKKAEAYWSEEYLRYAKLIQAQKKEEKKDAGIQGETISKP